MKSYKKQWCILHTVFLVCCFSANAMFVFVHLYFYKDSPMPLNRNIWIWCIRVNVLLAVTLSLIDFKVGILCLRRLLYTGVFICLVLFVNFIWEFFVGSAC